MSRLFITVELVHKTEVYEAVREAKELARHLSVSFVYFVLKGKGVSFSIGKDADPDWVMKEFKEGTRHIVSG